MTCYKQIILAFFLIWVGVGERLRFGSFRGVPFIFNYTEGDGWCNPSFECDIISYICWKLGEGHPCSLTIFDSLEQRITALENNDVDIVVSRFSVSPEREQRVDFVRPYYYSSGALLFSAPENKDDFVAYEELISQPVCMDVGYYVAQTLADDLGLFVFPSTKESVLELISRKFCIATITDSAFVLDGLEQTDLEPLYETPYAIAISKSPKFPNLKNNIQKIILEMLTKKENGRKSVLENLEETYLLPVGISQNSKLKELSDSVTQNDGEYIGEENENEIWQAANLTAVRKFSKELLFIDPKNDKICRDSMKEIYDSYRAEKDLYKSPIMFENSVVYTFTQSILDPTKMIESYNLIKHPFFEDDTTAYEIAVDNPQFLTTVQLIQNAFLQDEKNKKQGQFFYVATPYDASPVVNDPDLKASLISPTRVIKTALFQVLQEQNEENELLVLTGCGVGELRNW